jgi:hypothetical protein
MMSSMAVNRLVAARAEDGGPENPARLCVHDDLHQPLRLTFLYGAADAAHGSTSNKQRAARGARLALGHADASERRVYVERVSRDAFAHAPALAVEQVGGDDLVVVVSGRRSPRRGARGVRRRRWRRAS